MTFTPTPPTKPGAYYYKNPEGELFLIDVIQTPTNDTNELLARVNTEEFDLNSFRGEWSPRLVPVDEVAKAFFEGWKKCHEDVNPRSMGDYDESHAKQVVEGEI